MNNEIKYAAVAAFFVGAETVLLDTGSTKESASLEAKKYTEKFFYKVKGPEEYNTIYAKIINDVYATYNKPVEIYE
jgi:predicted cation transporter